MTGLALSASSISTVSTNMALSSSILFDLAMCGVWRSFISLAMPYALSSN